MIGKKLDANFKEVEKWQDARYLVHNNGDVELLRESIYGYSIITVEEILKLAEIVRGMEE